MLNNKQIEVYKNIVLDTESECIIFPPHFTHLPPEEQYVFICRKEDGLIKRVVYLKEK